jgi:hypothetical protein
MYNFILKVVQMQKMLEVEEEVDTVEKIKMINKDKNKQEESLINNLRLS